MARRKRELDEEFAGNIRRLEAAGCRTYTATEISVTLKQFVDPRLSRLVELENGRMAYKIYMEMINGLRELAGINFELKMTWNDLQFYWLREPTRLWHGQHYCFPGRMRLRYHVDETLNGLIGESLPPGAERSGVLLGIGGPISSEFKHGDSLHGLLALVDGFGKEHPTNIKLLLDRERCLRFRSATTGRRYDLFDRELAPAVSEPLTSPSGNAPVAQDFTAAQIGQVVESVEAGGVKG